MKWSWKIGEVSRIGIYVHASFALLLAWVAMGQLTSGQHMSGAFEAIGFTLAVFGCIALHESATPWPRLLRQSPHATSRSTPSAASPTGANARAAASRDRVALAGPMVNVVPRWVWPWGCSSTRSRGPGTSVVAGPSS